MLHDELFTKYNYTSSAKTLSETERQVDDMYSKYLYRSVQDTPAANKCTTFSLLVVKCLERIADHATHIDESVIYITTGKRVTLK